MLVRPDGAPLFVRDQRSSQVYTRMWRKPPAGAVGGFQKNTWKDDGRVGFHTPVESRAKVNPERRSGQTGTSGSKPQDLILGTDDVVVHEFAGGVPIAAADGLQNLGMLAGRELAVVTDIDGRVHDPFHLAADVSNRT